MTHTINLLFAGNYSIYSLVISALLGMSAGFFLRLAVNAKQKGNIIKLENEMLANHSRILSLEKKISGMERENFELLNNGHKKADLKIS